LLAQAPAVPCGAAEAESTSEQPQAASSWCKQQPKQPAAAVGRCAGGGQIDAVRAAAAAAAGAFEARRGRTAARAVHQLSHNARSLMQLVYKTVYLHYMVLIILCNPLLNTHVICVNVFICFAATWLSFAMSAVLAATPACDIHPALIERSNTSQ
jgi:hypothetical protein